MNLLVERERSELIKLKVLIEKIFKNIKMITLILVAIFSIYFIANYVKNLFSYSNQDEVPSVSAFKLLWSSSGNYLIEILIKK